MNIYKYKYVALTVAFAGSLALSACKQDLCYCGEDDAKKEDTVVTIDSIQTCSFTVNGATFKVCAVEHGVFYMGAQATSASSRNYDENLTLSSYTYVTKRESPVHRVTLTKDFAMGEFPVTQKLYNKVMKLSEYWTVRQNDNYPAYQIEYSKVTEFIDSLNNLLHADGQLGENLEFRLPTEAQWEYAARGGQLSKKTIYAGSDTVDNVCDYKTGYVYKVGQYKANELGLYDMTGLVWEWCSDTFGDYTSSSVTDPTGTSSNQVSSSHVIRGGGFDTSTPNIYYRVSSRLYSYGSSQRTDSGFRLCLVYKD